MGSGALDLMEREQPDLVILDLMLPGMDGFEVLEAMRQRPNLATMPVVVLTAKAQLGSAVGSKPMNVHAYLTKPVSAETLVHTVQEVLTEIQIPASRERRALEIACVESWPGCAGELLAAALAAALAEHAPTLLIDVEGNGRGAFVFDLEPRMSLEELEAGADPTRGLGAPTGWASGVVHRSPTGSGAGGPGGGAADLPGPVCGLDAGGSFGTGGCAGAPPMPAGSPHL
jgi:CheY-like chemotaxis protein